MEKIVCGFIQFTRLINLATVDMAGNHQCTILYEIQIARRFHSHVQIFERSLTLRLYYTGGIKKNEEK